MHVDRLQASRNSVQLRYNHVSIMNKRQLHHLSRRLSWLKAWYFLVLALIFGVIFIFALRANNQHMIKLRDAVYSADKQAGDVQTALKNLQTYVTSHMNTDLNAGSSTVYPPVQLKYTYERLVKAQSDSVAQTNSKLYNEAQANCERLNPTDFSGHNRIPCIEQYVLSHSTQLKQVPDSLYKFAFITPKWSPDLAGWSLVLAIFSFVAFVVVLITSQLLKRQAR
ncbi:MAG: hypothetical protein NVS1B10_02270 [Candidatus Saccharimonadales bacterium]